MVVILKRFKVFFLNSLLMITSSLVLQIIKLVFNIYVSNKVTPEVLGVFQLIMAAYFFGITLASSGINISCMRVVSEELALGNSFGVRNSSKMCIKISVLVSFLASIIFYVNADKIVKFCFQDKVGPNIIYLICCALPLIAVSSAITGYFIAVRRVYKTVIGQFLEQFSKIIAIIVLFNLYSSSFSLENVCFALILGDLISEIACFVYLIIVYVFDLRFHFSTTNSSKFDSFVFRICRILFPVAITSCIKSGISTVKQLIIPSSLEKNGKNSAEALSEYGIISGMAMPIVMFPATFLVAVAGLLIPEFSRYYVKQDYKKIKLYSDKLIIGSFLFSLILVTFFYIFGDNIAWIIYHNNEVGSYIRVFSLLIPFMYVDIIIDNILKGLDSQTNVMIINIIDLAVSTVFIFFFVPIFGIKAYIVSIFISEILNLSLSLKNLLKIERKLSSNDDSFYSGTKSSVYKKNSL